MSRSSWYQKSKDSTHRDQEVIAALNEIVSKHRRWGFGKCYHRLRHQGKNWNHKRVHRVYCAMKLNLPRRAKKRIPRRERQPLEVVKVPNEMWSMDFMHDSLYQGRCFRTLNIIDEGVREALAIEVDPSLPAARVVRVLEQLKERRGLPNQIKLPHIQLGKPTQNAFIERFNRTFRYEVLDAYLFEDLEHVREVSWKWLLDYNEERPHQALNNLTPHQFSNQKLSA